MYIMIYGNPCDGFRYVGPFEDHDLALAYGEAGASGDWWITELDPPASDEGEPDLIVKKETA
jgi:hypothetical protein